MHLPRFLPIFALAALAGSGLATDYQLTIKGTGDQVSAAAAIGVFGMKLQKGDRITSVSFGKLSGPNPVKVAVDSDSAGTILAQSHTAKGFAGKVFAAIGQAPSGSLPASLVIIPPVVSREDGGILGKAKDFASSPSGIFTFLALAALIAGALLFRPRRHEQTNVYALPNRRKSIDESLRDIQKRLEQIDETQRDLVRKPPVLRSFRNQIDGFGNRLDKVDGQLKALHAGITRGNESLTALENAQRELKGQVEAESLKTTSLTTVLDTTHDTLEKHVELSSAKSAEVASEVGKSLLDLQQRLTVLGQSQTKTAQSTSELRATLASITSQLSGVVEVTRASTSGIAEQVVDLRASFEERSQKATDLTGVESKITDLHGAIGQLQVEQKRAEAGLEQLLSGLQELSARDNNELIAQMAEGHAAGEKMLSALGDDIKAAVAKANEDRFTSLTENQNVLEQKLAALSEALGNLSIPTHADQFAHLEEGIATLGTSLEGTRRNLEEMREANGQASSLIEERISEIGARVDQRESILLSLQSRVSETDASSADVSEVLPVIADLRLELHDLASDQGKANLSMDGLQQVISEAAKLADAKSEALAQEQARTAETLQQVLEAINRVTDGAEQQPVPASAGLDHVGASLERLSQSLAEMAAGQERYAHEIERRLSDEIAKLNFRTEERFQETASDLEVPMDLDREAQAIHPVAEAVVPSIEEAEIAAQTIQAVPEQSTEIIAEPAKIAATAIETDPPLDETSADEEAPGGWVAYGGSPSKRWSSAVASAIGFESSDNHLEALTPTETPAVGYGVGPVLFPGGRIVYGHNTTLRGIWPGRGAATANLKQQIPCEPWRLAAQSGHVFCVEEGQVEIVSLTSWEVHAHFDGNYVDQVCTNSRWAGLACSNGKAQIDLRNVHGRQFEQVRLPFSADEARAMVSDGEKIFVATHHAGLIRAELGEAEMLNEGENGIELISMSVHKNGLVQLVRIGDHDQVRLLSLDGSVQKRVDVEFTHGCDHPVLMGDRLYLVDSAKEQLVSINLRKMEVAGATPLPGGKVASFCGLFHASHHALVVTVANVGTSGSKVLLLDPKSNASMTVCDVNQPSIQVIAAGPKLVVATSCFYQNMIRVFDPFQSEGAVKLAA